MNETQAQGSISVTGLKIDASLITKLNLADFQNAVPLIREINLVNDTDQALVDVELVLNADPPFLKSRHWRIDTLAAGSRYPIRDLDVKLDGGLLARLTEAEVATVWLTLHTAGTQAPVLAQADHPLELLPRNQWGGLSHLPDLVAAFVQPNDPAIDRLLKRAAEVLRQNQRNPALDGYAGGARRAWELASAIWGAVVGMQLDYALPPASFEQSGQKVRSPSQIESAGLATCFDLALLFCAALEQVGLNPLLVFTQGHAFAGVWLQSEEFSTTVVDDITALRKRIMLKELVLFETTLVTQRPAVPFRYATEHGAGQVGEDKDDTFHLAVDIRRARLQRIKPLSSAGAGATSVMNSEPAASYPVIPLIEEAPDLPDSLPVAVEPDAANGTEDRLRRWQRKLLDLSLRNQLLNFKGGKKALKLDAPDPGALEDLLASGQSIKLLPRPALMDGTDQRDQALFESRERDHVRRSHALDALQRREVFASVPQAELENRLVELFRSARTTLQEGGANTLYLALGFLSWLPQNHRDGQRCRAPLILIPVSLRRKSVRSGFSLVLHEDEPRFNPTLIEMLRQDFALNLGVFEGELPHDDAGLDIATIWKQVGHAIKDIPGWEVTEDVVLSTFSFVKYLMWKDLAERSAQLRGNPVVRHLLDTPRDAYPAGVPFPPAHELDTHFKPEQVFCPLPADSSQLSAVLAAAQGKDFVLIGPPGTGKSQTIANLITHSLAEGRRVLFVSEKIAALDVVYRRLRDIGLGAFCLELHSSKARKLDVLKQLEAAWSSSGQLDAEQWQRQAERLKHLRDALNLYAQRLHQRHRNGLSLFDAIGTVSAEQEVPALALHWPTPDQHDHADIQQLRDTAERLDVNAQAVGHTTLTQHPLALVGQSDWSPSWQQQFVAAVGEVVTAAQAVIASAQGLTQAIGLPAPALTPDTGEALYLLAHGLPTAAGHDWRFVLRPDARSICQRLQEGAALLRRHAELNVQLSTTWPASARKACAAYLAALVEHHSALSVRYTKAIESQDIAQLQQQWKQAERAFWPKSWVGKRRIRQQLATVIPKGAQPDVGRDLRHWTAIRALRQKIVAVTPSQTREDIWTRHAPDLAHLRAAVDFMNDWCLHAEQGALSVAHPLVEQGACGPNLVQAHQHLRHRSETEQALAAFDDLHEATAGVWNGLATHLEHLATACQLQQDLSRALTRLAHTPEQISACITPLHALLGDANALLEPSGRIAQACAHYQASWQYLASCRETLAHIGQFAETDTPHWQALTLHDLITYSQFIVQAERSLRRWCAWRKARDEAMALGLAALVDGMEQGQIGAGLVRRAFEVNYARWWLHAVVDQEPVIRSFVSAEHEQRIRDFRALDERFTALTRDFLRARLCANLPAQEDVSRNSQWGILKREISKKRAHLPLRELMVQIPEALTKLTPCLLMSPLSIAQYLQASANAFDLVVFDEASQIPVWDAIGAMARGRQVVMVGDPKQLPPTSFFDRAESGLDDEDVEADLESILDECIGANLPTHHLNWHYRSRHESLIAFSNHAYYDGELVTFPSPVTADRAVSLHVVSGTYQKGGARTNPTEAKALVEEVVTRLTDPAFRDQRLTVGVVTFNAEQQKLIEDLFDEARRQDPRLEPYFDDTALEPVFVKNLESVQGDERDLIYFSITYGPNSAGQLAMNFGPLNRQGGERRLNVAITRARCELRVFASFRAEQMDLARTQAIGVRDLKHFLEFAERGAHALASTHRGSIGDFESPFEQAVASALSQRGWQVQAQIGVSAFRIDLGIIDPDAPGRYLAGVECDGATYHRSATARDRDKLREQVLRGLGWEIVRVWSTDWWIDPTGTLDKLDARLHDLLTEQRKQRAARDIESRHLPENTAPALNPPVMAVTESDQKSTTAPTPETAGNIPAQQKEESRAEVFARQTQTEPTSTYAISPTALSNAAYRLTNPAEVVTSTHPDRFFDVDYIDTLLTMIAHVIRHEGPVRDTVLAHRIARAHGWQRTGSRIRERILALANSRYRTTDEDVGRFYWPSHLDHTIAPPFRVPVDEESARSVDEISLPELASLARHAIAQGAQGEEVYVLMARQLGLQKLRAASRARLENALRVLSTTA